MPARRSKSASPNSQIDSLRTSPGLLRPSLEPGGDSGSGSEKAAPRIPSEKQSSDHDGARASNSNSDETLNQKRPLSATDLNLCLDTADSIKPVPIEWLDAGYIPLGKVTDVIGEGGIGKSVVLLDYAARLTMGRPMPGSGACHDPCNVIIVSAEDDAADTLVPRLMAAGADLTRVHIFNEDRKGGPLDFPGDISMIERMIEETGARFVLFDPVMAFIGNVKSGVDNEVRKALGPMKGVAARTGAAIIFLRHVNKDKKMKAADRGGGSVAFRNLARAGLAFATDPSDEESEIHYMAQSKANLARGVPTLSYRIESQMGVLGEGCDGAYGQPVVVWLDEEGPSFKDLFEETGENRQERAKKRAAAEKWVRKKLSGGSSVATTTFEQEASAAGHKPATLRRACEKLGVESERFTPKDGPVFYMKRLPD